MRCYQDDILVIGTDDKEHLQNLENGLKRLCEFGLRVKKSKCFLFNDSIQYLGHKIDVLPTSEDKVYAITNAPSPNIASVLNPLKEL